MRIAFLFLLFVVFIVSGCHNLHNIESNSKNEKNIGHYPVVINNYNSDRTKTEIVFVNKPKRVVVNQQNTIETLLALNQENSIVAASCTSGHTTEFMEKYRSRAESLPQIAKHDFSLESVLMMRPDFIIGWQSTFSNRSLRSTYFWRNRGVNTYIVENSNSILPIGRVEDEYSLIRNMGEIFDCRQESLDMIADIKKEINEAIVANVNKTKQRVIVLELQGSNIVVYGREKLAGDMVTKLGGEVIECGSRIGPENLIVLNPDVIFVVCIGWKEDAAFCVDQIMNNKAYRSIKAIKNKRVYAIPLMYMYASSTRTLDGIRVFKKGLYPDLQSIECGIAELSKI